jgi:hypothetical protein
MSKTISNRRYKDKKKRAKLRARLRAQGVSEERIEQIIAQRRADDYDRGHARSQALSREQILANTDDSLWPDDSGYKPAKVDPLLRGPARVQGMTAKVVKRRSSITAFQHEREVGKSARVGQEGTP